MAEPVHVKVTRPYSSAEDYIAGDAWTVDRRDMLLVGQGPLEPKTVLRFEVLLESGERVIRGEGEALVHQPAIDGRPGGLRVLFRRFDSQSKALLRRALVARAAQTEATAEDDTPAQDTADDTAAHDAEDETAAQGAPAGEETPQSSPAATDGPPTGEPSSEDAPANSGDSGGEETSAEEPPTDEGTAGGEATAAELAAATQSDASPSPAEPAADDDIDTELVADPADAAHLTANAAPRSSASGTRPRTRGPVAAPINRDDLLARLRERARDARRRAG